MKFLGGSTDWSICESGVGRQWFITYGLKHKQQIGGKNYIAKTIFIPNDSQQKEKKSQSRVNNFKSCISFGTCIWAGHSIIGNQATAWEARVSSRVPGSIFLLKHRCGKVLGLRPSHHMPRWSSWLNPCPVGLWGMRQWMEQLSLSLSELQMKRKIIL